MLHLEPVSMSLFFWDNIFEIFSTEPNRLFLSHERRFSAKLDENETALKEKQQKQNEQQKIAQTLKNVEILLQQNHLQAAELMD